MSAPRHRMLVAENLAKSFRGRGVTNGVSVQVAQGQTIGLLGPNGAGKTTLFRLLTGLIAPDRGRIRIDDTDITYLPFHGRARLGLGYLPQHPFVPGSLKVEQAVTMALEPRRLKPAVRRERVTHLLEKFHLAALRAQLVGTLSGGERRRCEIAVVLACEPRFLLLDEPLASVDPVAIEDIRQFVAQLRAEGIGTIVTDHNVRALLGITDHLYVLGDGAILAEGSPEAILANPKVRETYLGTDFRL